MKQSNISMCVQYVRKCTLNHIAFVRLCMHGCLNDIKLVKEHEIILCENSDMVI